MNKWKPHHADIKWYLKRPRKVPSDLAGSEDFSFKKHEMPGRNKRYPEACVWGWRIYYKGEFVIDVYTKQEVKDFLREKLEN